MKKFLLLFLASILFLSSCSSSDLDCNSDMAKNTVKELLLEFELKNGGNYSFLHKMSQEEIELLFKEIVKIKQVRTIGQDEKLKSCDCKANLVFDVNEEMMNEIKKNTENFFLKKLTSGLVYEEGIEIYYNIQETADGEIYVETQELDNLDVNVTVYGYISKKFKEKNNNQTDLNENKNEELNQNEKQSTVNVNYKKGDVLRFQSKENNGENKYILTFKENNKIEIIYRYFDYSYTDIAEYNDGKININGDDEMYILEENILKVFNPESQEYDLHYKQ